MGWLQYNFSFSFADYYDPMNLNFGPLRVFNDDYIQPENGFHTHPHRNMEIVTFVLEGQLQHLDNTGGQALLVPGEVQRMSAGTGVLHSEVNTSKNCVTNSLQLWFMPKEQGIAPSYEQNPYDSLALKNALHKVVSGRKKVDDVTYIHQDLDIYLSELEAGRSIVFTQEANRLTYVFVIEGQLSINGTGLERRDAARITDSTTLELTALEQASFMFIDLPRE
jgi:redox-sensitive bicupin YhaK (pirin superfamily)